jgi:FixJ family two-component response regulator
MGPSLRVGHDRVAVPLVAGDEVMGVLEAALPADRLATELPLESLGTVAALLANARARARAEQALENERWLRSTVLGELEDGVLVVDERGAAVCANDGLASLCGVGIGADGEIDTLPAPLRDALAAGLAGGAVDTLHDLGERSVRVRARGVRNPLGDRAAVVVTSSAPEGGHAAGRAASLGAFVAAEADRVSELSAAIEEGARTVGAHVHAGGAAALHALYEVISDARTTSTALASLQRADATVLVVDDDEAVLRTIARMLDGVGYHVLTASTPDDAIAIATRHRGLVDLLVTDILVPGMSGPKIAHELVLSQPQMKVMFISGFTDAEIIHIGPFGEAVTFLHKPFSKRDLVAAAEGVLARPRSAAAAAARGRDRARAEAGDDVAAAA